MSEIPKAYEPQSVEDKWYDFWLKQGCFTADPKSAKPAYSIVIPPPNVTGMLHMGHVLNNTIQDILSRKARMDGKEVLWLPGTDHAGIATQVMVEKQLKKEEKKSRHDLGREEFLKRVWVWKEKHGDIIINQLKKLGCSCDWTRERFTMDPEYSRCVQKVFVELYKKGLIYRGKRMVNWCPVSQTALSDEEVEMKPQKGFMYHFKVQVAESLSGSSRGNEAQTKESAIGNQQSAMDQSLLTSAATEEKKSGPEMDAEGRTWLTIATTRPETIPGDTAVAVNPKDSRYAHLIGKHIVRPLPAELPLAQKLIPIIGDEHVDFEFGTGVLKVTPAHDKADFDIGTRHKLPLIEVINADGSMNPLAGEALAGLDRFKARKVAVELLTEQGVMIELKPYENSVGFSQRADVPIEPRLSEQWFLKYPAVEQSKACVEQSGAATQPEGLTEISPGQRPGLVGGKSSHPEGVPEGSAAPAGAEASLRGEPRTMSGANFQKPSGLNDSESNPKMRFHPQRWAKVYDHWLTNIQDWCISRQLWWGHRIPVWYNTQTENVLKKETKVSFLTGEEIKGGDHISAQRAAAVALVKASLIKGVKNESSGIVLKATEPELIDGLEGRKDFPSIWVTAALGEIFQNSVRVAEVADGKLFYGAAEIGGLLFRVELIAKLSNDGTASYVRHSAWHLKGKKSGGDHVQVQTLISDVSRDLAFVRCQIESPGADWEQDPDVLDTWFSSWLWPFATMGWPEQTETLKKFYPTTDLVTGPDIIFFWVARMIMAGYEFMGDAKFALPDAMPFQNVYFTGIIRDKQGRKMSKTLGNSPDPLVLIAQYGADALRFGTMRSAPLGQDVLFDEKDVELGRNFCNKLWNACRFRQMQSSAGVSPAPGEGNQPEGRRDARPTFEIQGEIEPALLSSDDKWILLKLDAAIREVTIALNEYKFSEATAALYRFFWSEYCDWYVEASKAVFYGADEARKANTLAVIDFVLSHAVRMFHPFLPFITEELWHGMGFSTDMPDNQGGKTIMNAPWPMPFDEDFTSHYGLDEGCLERVDAKFDLVTQGRNLRRAGNIQAGKKVKYVFKPAQPLTAHDAEVIRLLLNAESLEVSADYQPPKGTPTVRTELGELLLPLEGHIDREAEIARLNVELEKIQSEIVKVEQKLANPNFTQKVPPQVLQEHEKRLADWRAKLAHTQARVADFASPGLPPA